MLFFPQLETGAMGQYPLRRRLRTRTVENRMPGGAALRYSDATAGSVEWRLTFRDLTDGEAEALAGFFAAVEGRLGTFTFLDPAGNLLAWSEQMDQNAWAKNALTSVTGGIGDPFGGTRAWRVAGPGPAGVAQTLNVPEQFHYCLSVWVRAEGGGTVALMRGGQRSEHRLTETWKRLAYGSAGAGGGESVRFGLELPAGGSVEVFGFQVEAQAGASGYKRTTSKTGVYTNARMGEDRLEVIATEPGRHYCTLSVIHGDHI